MSTWARTGVEDGRRRSPSLRLCPAAARIWKWALWRAAPAFRQSRRRARPRQAAAVRSRRSSRAWRTTSAGGSARSSACMRTRPASWSGSTRRSPSAGSAITRMWSSSSTSATRSRSATPPLPASAWLCPSAALPAQSPRRRCSAIARRASRSKSATRPRRKWSSRCAAARSSRSSRIRSSARGRRASYRRLTRRLSQRPRIRKQRTDARTATRSSSQPQQGQSAAVPFRPSRVQKTRRIHAQASCQSRQRRSPKTKRCSSTLQSSLLPLPRPLTADSSRSQLTWSRRSRTARRRSQSCPPGTASRADWMCRQGPLSSLPRLQLQARQHLQRQRR